MFPLFGFVAVQYVSGTKNLARLKVKMASHEVTKHDIDMSSNEKGQLDGQLEHGGDQYPYDSQLPPDPDAHLSAEEKAVVVSRY
jgi:hypothetical protein